MEVASTHVEVHVVRLVDHRAQERVRVVNRVLTDVKAHVILRAM